MAKKRENKVARARQGIGGFLALIAIGFLVMSFYFGTDLNNLGPAVEGEDYTLLDAPQLAAVGAQPLGGSAAATRQG